MKTINLPIKDLTKFRMHNYQEPLSMQILSEWEETDLIDDLLPADDDLQQFFINL